ncbi:hypothetical protein ACLBXO_08680 [Methylobacterium sp. C33D]|uniref:hypothetical protein n=1 Tax=Methylobacterium mesophilicum TaxID=39956 RepID=UPI002F352F7D
MDSRRFYVVRGARSNGITTYKCPTVDWALRKLRDFTSQGYRDITVLDPDGRALSEADLIVATDGPGGAPSEEALPAAPQISRQPALA